MLKKLSNLAFIFIKIKLTVRISQKIHEFCELRRFQKLPLQSKKIVFYSEGKSHWVHLKPIIEELTKKHNISLCYISSSIEDPGLSQPYKNMLTFYIGVNSARTLFFSMLHAEVLVMTLPDLQSFHLKRSPYPVKYVYVHHSLISTHAAYRQDAFDNFDVILCSGQHHVQEIQARERQANLPPKVLVEHGYGMLDRLIETYCHQSLKMNRLKKDLATVLIAPTWGKHALLEQFGREIVQVLLDSDFQVIIRAHPQTLINVPNLVKKLEQNFCHKKNLRSSSKSNPLEDFCHSDILISDWSGVALEYAFSTEKPVIFIDTPQKIRNSEYFQLGLVPLELGVRDKIGVIVPVNRLKMLPAFIKQALEQQSNFIPNIRRLKEQYVFNLGKSKHVGAQYIANMIN